MCNREPLLQHILPAFASTGLQGDKWRRAFLQVAAAVGVHAQQSSDPQLDAVLAAVANLQQSELRLQVCTMFDAPMYAVGVCDDAGHSACICQCCCVTGGHVSGQTPYSSHKFAIVNMASLYIGCSVLCMATR
jgi:hypothetical protein